MNQRVALVFALLLAAPAAGCLPDIRSTAPAWDNGTAVWYNGFPPVPGLGKAAEDILTECLSVCPADKANELQEEWEPAVYFKPDPFDCGDDNPLVSGCQPYYSSDQDRTYVILGWQPTVAETALCPELLHACWETCFGRTGERFSYLADGGGYISTDSDYGAFVAQCVAQERG
jgi:hypothetical protein